MEHWDGSIMHLACRIALAGLRRALHERFTLLIRVHLTGMRHKPVIGGHSGAMPPGAGRTLECKMLAVGSAVQCPYPYRLFRFQTPRSDALAVRAYSESDDRSLVPLEHTNDIPAAHIPNDRFAILAPADQPCARLLLLRAWLIVIWSVDLHAVTLAIRT